MLSELGPFWPWLSCSLVIDVSSPRPVHIQTVHLKDYVHCSHFVVVYMYMHAHIYIHIYTVHAVLCMLCFYVNCSQSVVLIVVLHTLDLLLFYSQAVHVLFCLRCLCTFSPCFAVLVLYTVYALLCLLWFWSTLFMLCYAWCGFVQNHNNDNRAQTMYKTSLFYLLRQCH